MSQNFTTIAAKLFENIIPGNGGVRLMHEEDEIIFKDLRELANGMIDENYQPYKTGEILKRYQEKYQKNDIHLAETLGIDNTTEQGKRMIRELKSSKKYIPRSWAIKLAFLYGLNLEEANLFLNELRKPVLHLRDYKELIYGFMIDEHRTFEEAEELIDEYTEVYTFKQDNSTLNSETTKRGGTVEIATYTAAVADELTKITQYECTYETKLDAFRNLLNSDEMKKVVTELNYTASKYYRKHIDAVCEYLNYDCNGRYAREAKYHLKMYRETLPNIFGEENVPKLNEFQNKIVDEHKIDQDIDKFLRDSEELGKMYNVLRDVPRMNYLVATLLYVSNVKWDDWEDDYNNDTWDMGFEEFMFDQCVEYTNFVLNECGYPLLNPRCYFDYLILLSYTTIQPHETFDKLFHSMGI